MTSQSDQSGNTRGTVQLGCTVESTVVSPSARTARLCMHFGIPLCGSKIEVVEPTGIPLEEGRIVLITGPSGSGKTTALEQIEQQRPGACLVQRIGFPADAAIIDRIAPRGPLDEAVALLTSCALSEPGLWVRPYAALSEGEKFRARLARAVALKLRSRPAGPLLCDEFCCGLHRRAARAISFNLRKLVTRRRLCAVVACSDDDILPDLRPDVVVRLRGNGRCAVIHPRVSLRRHPSFLRQIRIEAGGKRDYREFAAMHYRATDELGFVDKVFVLRERSGGDILGIVVYARGPLELRLRNQATGGVFSGSPARVNRDLRILRRLVIHPDVRGCGLGHYLVGETLPLVGTEYVECLAAMGEFNPVFEKAGMERIGQYDLPRNSRTALEKLRRMDVDPRGWEFPTLVCRRRRVREVVARVVYDWYANTTVGGESRIARQSPQTLAQTFRGLIASRPVYYLWRRKRLAA